MTWIIVLIAVVAVAVAVVAVLQTRTTSLKRQFGPEYDRLVETTGDRKAAEVELRKRTKRHDSLAIEELSPESAASYVERWREVQLTFVDDPAGALEEADQLVEKLLSERGYPVDDVDERVAMVSVDHPRLVGDYRSAYAVKADPPSDGEEVIDQRRHAFQQYRSLFVELLGHVHQGEIDNDHQ